MEHCCNLVTRANVLDYEWIVGLRRLRQGRTKLADYFEKLFFAGISGRRDRRRKLSLTHGKTPRNERTADSISPKVIRSAPDWNGRELTALFDLRAADHMAVNKTSGDNACKGAIKKRCQTKTKRRAPRRGLRGAGPQANSWP
jgi:hypothetical protein